MLLQAKSESQMERKALIEYTLRSLSRLSGHLTYALSGLRLGDDSGLTAPLLTVQACAKVGKGAGGVRGRLQGLVREEGRRTRHHPWDVGKIRSRMRTGPPLLNEEKTGEAKQAMEGLVQSIVTGEARVAKDSLVQSLAGSASLPLLKQAGPGDQQHVDFVVRRSANCSASTVARAAKQIATPAEEATLPTLPSAARAIPRPARRVEPSLPAMPSSPTHSLSQTRAF